MEKEWFSFHIDEEMIEKIIIEQAQSKIEELDSERVFWTMKDLEYVTGCSEGYIRDKFFYDDRFKEIRRKSGRKWLFPAKKTKEFLLEWLNEQPNE